MAPRFLSSLKSPPPLILCLTEFTLKCLLCYGSPGQHALCEDSPGSSEWADPNHGTQHWTYWVPSSVFCFSPGLWQSSAGFDWGSTEPAKNPPRSTAQIRYSNLSMYKYIGRHIPKNPPKFFSHFRTMLLREKIGKGEGASNLMGVCKVDKGVFKTILKCCHSHKISVSDWS